MCKYLVGPLQFMTVGRDKKDSKEEREKLIEDIKTRQLKAEKGEAFPLLIYPEGCTTNGTGMIEFKRGAFMSLRGVKPHVAVNSSLTGVSMCHGDAISMVAFIQVGIHCGWSTYTIKELPVFEPNEYFWKNHWDGKEEKYALYARVMRQIMCDAGNI